MQGRSSPAAAAVAANDVVVPRNSMQSIPRGQAGHEHLVITAGHHCGVAVLRLFAYQKSVRSGREISET